MFIFSCKDTKLGGKGQNKTTGSNTISLLALLRSQDQFQGRLNRSSLMCDLVHSPHDKEVVFRTVKRYNPRESDMSHQIWHRSRGIEYPGQLQQLDAHPSLHGGEDWVPILQLLNVFGREELPPEKGFGKCEQFLRSRDDATIRAERGHRLRDVERFGFCSKTREGSDQPYPDRGRFGGGQVAE